MNEKAILEIGRIIRVIRRGWTLQRITPEQIIETYEFKQFKKEYPNLVKLVLR